MGKRQFKLTKEKETELVVAYDHSRDVTLSKKLLGVRLYGLGHPEPFICEAIGCSRTSLMGWCRQYQAEGVTGLNDKRRGGNSRKLSLSQRHDLRERLHMYTPRQVLGEKCATASGQHWTTADLQVAIHQWYDVIYESPTSYWLLLGECGLSYQRTEKIYQSRSEQKVADFEEQLEKNC